MENIQLELFKYPKQGTYFQCKETQNNNLFIHACFVFIDGEVMKKASLFYYVTKSGIILREIDLFEAVAEYDFVNSWVTPWVYKEAFPLYKAYYQVNISLAGFGYPENKACSEGIIKWTLKVKPLNSKSSDVLIAIRNRLMTVSLLEIREDENSLINFKASVVMKANELNALICQSLLYSMKLDETICYREFKTNLKPFLILPGIRIFKTLKAVNF